MTIADPQVWELRFPPRDKTLEAERGSPVPSTSYSLCSNIREAERAEPVLPDLGPGLAKALPWAGSSASVTKACWIHDFCV